MAKKNQPEVKTEPVAAATAEVEQAQVQEAAPVAAQKKTAKAASTVNYIQDVAIKVESLTKAKALTLATTLVDTIETSYFELGGVLGIIKKQSWFDGSPDFGTFVANTFGFQVRKADYLIDIYNQLVDKQIPWEKVKDLGWTKLKDLAKVLTPENVDEWVEKASKLTVKELQALLAGAPEEGGTDKTTSDVVKKNFKLHPDQAATVDSALAKAKGELGTDHDNVAIDAIAMAYLGGTTEIDATTVDPVAFLQKLGIGAAIEAFNAAFPDQVLSLEDAPEAAGTEVAEA